MTGKEKEFYDICIKVLNDIEYPYSVNDIELTKMEDMKIARGKHKGENMTVWNLSIVDNSIFQTTDFLDIIEKTKEPVSLLTKHGGYEILKDSEGKYYME